MLHMARSKAFFEPVDTNVDFPKLEKKLDRIFSNWVRRRHADQGGTVECVTCRKIFHFSEVHAGHYIKRQHCHDPG